MGITRDKDKKISLILEQFAPPPKNTSEVCLSLKNRKGHNMGLSTCWRLIKELRAEGRLIEIDPADFDDKKRDGRHKYLLPVVTQKVSNRWELFYKTLISSPRTNLVLRMNEYDGFIGVTITQLKQILELSSEQRLDKYFRDNKVTIKSKLLDFVYKQLNYKRRNNLGALEEQLLSLLYVSIRKTISDGLTTDETKKVAKMLHIITWSPEAGWHNWISENIISWMKIEEEKGNGNCSKTCEILRELFDIFQLPKTIAEELAEIHNEQWLKTDNECNYMLRTTFDNIALER